MIFPNSELKGEADMKYECSCGYIYDPAVGDPTQGIAPGTAFEDLPDTWRCPVCKASKASFDPKK